MENKKLDQFQNQENRIEPKIRVSRDGKWIIMRVPGIEQAIIKSVNYFEKILENAKNKTYGTSVEKVKG